MNAKFFTAALIVAALGCAQSAAPTPPVVATSVATTRAPLSKVSKTEPKVLRPVGVAQSMQPLENTPHVIVHHTKEGGVGLTGPEHTYLESIDSSGWSGRSPSPPPEAIGGGPTTTTTTTSDEDPYAE